MKQFVAIFVITILFGCFGAEPQKTGKEGKPVPDFSLLLTDSITMLHASDIPIGKPFVLFFMSPVCPYCKAQTELMIEHIDDLKDIQFYFISSYPIPMIKDFVGRHDLNKYSNFHCGVDSANKLFDYFEITGVPFSAIYNKNKILTRSYMGKIYTSQILKATKE